MSKELIDLLNLTGSILSIISFFPIMIAAFLWIKNQTFKTIRLKDKDGNEFSVAVRRKYLNNRDLTPMVQDMYKGDNNLATSVRKSILEQTLNTHNNLKHVDSRKVEDIKVS